MKNYTGVYQIILDKAIESAHKAGLAHSHIENLYALSQIELIDSRYNFVKWLLWQSGRVQDNILTLSLPDASNAYAAHTAAMAVFKLNGVSGGLRHCYKL